MGYDENGKEKNCESGWHQFTQVDGGSGVCRVCGKRAIDLALLDSEPREVSVIGAGVHELRQFVRSNTMNPGMARWECPSDFAYWGDEDLTQYYVVFGHHRDSDLLVESNWDQILEALGGESETVKVIRFSHWAVGWVESIFVHEGNLGALRIASELLDRMDDYPVLDEDDFSERECDAANECWASMSVSDRVDLIKGSGGEVSIFAARHDWVPQGDCGHIQERLLG